MVNFAWLEDPWAIEVQAAATPNAVKEATNVTRIALVCLLNGPSSFNFVQSCSFHGNT
jgi:hypothetical protein